MRVVWLPFLLVSLAATASPRLDPCNTCPLALPCSNPDTVKQCVSFANSSCPGGVQLRNQCVPIPPHPVPVSGVVVPAFMVTHVVYAVPGASSSVSYSNGDTVGSSTSLTKSWKNNLDVTAGVRGGFLFASGQITFGVGEAWGGSSKDTVDVSIEQDDGYKKLGQVDGVDHDDDEVWFVAQPSFTVTVTEASVYGPGGVVWTINPQGPFTPYYMLVGELRGTRAIPHDVLTTIQGWGITAEYYPELLKADPFASADDSILATQHERFDLVGVFPYIPVSTPGYKANTQTFSLQRKFTNTSESQSQVSYSVSVRIGGSLGTEIAKSFWTVQDKFSFTNTTGTKDSTATSSQDTITVGQPAYGYTGPTVLRVYEDKIWKTFVTSLDWN